MSFAWWWCAVRQMESSWWCKSSARSGIGSQAVGWTRVCQLSPPVLSPLPFLGGSHSGCHIFLPSTPPCPIIALRCTYCALPLGCGSHCFRGSSCNSYSGSQEKRSRKLLFVKPKKRVVLMWIWMEFCPSSLLLPVEVVLLSLRLSWFLLILCPDSLCSCCMDLAGRGHVRMRVIFLAHPVHEGQPMKTEPDYESLGACWVSAEVCLGLIWIEACPSRERRRRRSAY